MRRDYLVPFINLGHLVDHLAMLVFPTVVLALSREWQRPYSELLPLSVGGFIAFGAFAIPAGWLADHWSRYKMLVVFYLGIGASLFVTGFAQTHWQIAAGLTLIATNLLLMFLPARSYGYSLSKIARIIGPSGKFGACPLHHG